MLLFRSEEHLRLWTASRGDSMGATLSPEQGWLLAKEWYEDRLSSDWTRKTPEEAKTAFDAIGLVGAFWQLGDEVSGAGRADTPGV